MPARLLNAKFDSHGQRVLELADTIEQVQSYNNFRGPKLACQLQHLHHKGYAIEARFGRERSPAATVTALNQLLYRYNVC